MRQKSPYSQSMNLVVLKRSILFDNSIYSLLSCCFVITKYFDLNKDKQAYCTKLQAICEVTFLLQSNMFLTFVQKMYRFIMYDNHKVAFSKFFLLFYV